MKKEFTINEYYLTTINEYGDKIDNDIDLLCDYLDRTTYKHLCDLAKATDNTSLVVYKSTNGITICGNEGAFTKVYAEDTPLNEAIDYINGEMMTSLLNPVDNVSVNLCYGDDKMEITIIITTEDDELETIVEVDHDTPIENVVRMVRNEVNNLLTPKTYHIKGYMDMTSQIEVNFGENEFNTLKEAYLAAKENLEYCDIVITESSTGLRILLTSNEIEIWNKTPYVHFKQARPSMYKDLEKIIGEIFLS